MYSGSVCDLFYPGRSFPADLELLMEKCHYCGFEYHPMLVATLKRGLNDGKRGMHGRIYVCEILWSIVDGKSKITPHDECKNKAEADGYTLRRDLTPTR